MTGASDVAAIESRWAMAVTTVLDRVRQIRRDARRVALRTRVAFVAQLRDGKVRPYIWPYHVAVALMGIYLTFIAEPLDKIAPAMGAIYTTWTTACIWSPVVTILGIWLARSTGGKRRYFGVWMQLLGNLSIGFMLAALEYAVLSETPWGAATVLAFLCPPYIGGCILLTMTAALEWWDIEQVKRALIAGDLL